MPVSSFILTLSRRSRPSKSHSYTWGQHGRVPKQQKALCVSVGNHLSVDLLKRLILEKTKRFLRSFSSSYRQKKDRGLFLCLFLHEKSYKKGLGVYIGPRVLGPCGIKLGVLAGQVPSHVELSACSEKRTVSRRVGLQGNAGSPGGRKTLENRFQRHQCPSSSSLSASTSPPQLLIEMFPVRLFLQHQE